MKTLRTPLGTVAALVAVATTAHANIIISDFSDVPLPVNQAVSVDIDSDSVADFSVDLVNGSMLEIDPIGSNLIATTGGQLNIYQLGDTIGASDPNLNASVSTPDILSSDYYVGVSFEHNSQFDTAWLQFNFDAQSNGTLVNAAWQATPAQSITIASVPEPGVCSLAAGLVAGLLAWGRRRNRHGRPA